MARKFLRFSRLVLVAYAAHVCTPRPLLAQQSGKGRGRRGEQTDLCHHLPPACHGLDGAGGEHSPRLFLTGVKSKA
jgi:hypothetical protein